MGRQQHEVEPNELVAFNIRLKSRFGEARELIELLNFARLLKQRNLDGYVLMAEYDSKASDCRFTLIPGLPPSHPTALAVLGVASETISQILWDGTVHHGKPMEA